MANGLPANAPRPTTPGATPRQRRRHFSSPRIMTMTEKIARLTLCRFSRESLFGLNASPNPRQRLSPLETAIAQKRSGTVSESASERDGGVVKNSGELKQIVIDFTGDFAILLALHRTFQVAERRRKLASHIVAGFIAANHLRPEKTLETPMNYPLSLQDNSHFRSRTRHDAPG